MKRSGSGGLLRPSVPRRRHSASAVGVLGITLSRLYTLCNQLIHGGATWNSKVNRVQLRDGVNLLGKLVPIVIETMIDHPGTVWRDPCYPVVDPKG
jgi:hypothetical protein